VDAAKLGHSLLKSLIQLRQEKGQILIEDVGAILESTAQGLHEENQASLFVKNEIRKMSQFILSARAEITALFPPEEPKKEGKEKEPPKNLTGVGVQLKEVVKATEKATDTILDATDAIENMIKGADEKTKKKILGEIAKIVEACSFQDITGQRITKAFSIIEDVEERVMNLMLLFSRENADVVEKAGKREKKVARKDEHLLNGPQLTGEGPSQAEIDALFANLKNDKN